MSLQIKYRFKSLDDVIGNKGTVTSLRSVFERKREDIPHAFLFHGQKGCGKTSMGRIVAESLKCDPASILEYDIGDMGGIETIRTLKEACQYLPIIGNIRVYVLDECFAKGTVVKTLEGDKEIQNISSGEMIYNLEGIKQVKNIFRNKISLDRVVRINTNSNPTFCSSDHLFFTDKGWIEAKNLTKNHLTFTFSCDTLSNNSYLRKEKSNYETKSLCILSNNFYSEKSKHREMLQQILCLQKEEPRKRIRNKVTKTMRTMWKSFYLHILSKKGSSFLFNELCLQTSTILTSYPKRTAFQRTWGENKQKFIEHGSRKKEEDASNNIRIHEEKQSRSKSTDNSKDVEYKANQWHIRSFQKNGEREQWQRTNRYRKDVASLFRRFLGTFFAHKNILWEKSRRISDLLQTRHSPSYSKSSNRNRWLEPFTSREEGARQKEGKTSKGVRVESVEVYKRGNNDESFRGIIGDKERSQGFVEFYDLEIDGHPSYYANDVLVHNCQSLTKPGQDALLKTLEEPPSHVYFVLCTTEPEKLKDTIRSRCHTYNMKPLNSIEMGLLLNRVLEEEGFEDYPKTILKEIISIAEGSPRNALVMLDAVIDISDEESAIAALSSIATTDGSTKELCQMLVQGNTWENVRGILKDVLSNSEPEKIRHAVLGYLSAVLLNSKKNDRISEIIDIFSESTMYHGRAILINQVYLALKIGSFAPSEQTPKKAPTLAKKEPTPAKKAPTPVKKPTLTKVSRSVFDDDDIPF